MAQIPPLEIAAVAAAVAAAGFAFNVIKALFDARRSREISARNAWEKYLEMAFAHPGLANRKLPRPDARSEAEDHEKYEWFISRMLYAAEEVLLYVGPDPEWRKVFLDQIEFHRKYLKKKGEDGGNRYLGGYSDDLKAIFREAEIEFMEPKGKKPTWQQKFAILALHRPLAAIARLGTSEIKRVPPRHKEAPPPKS